jgi:hypothetical protein
MEDKRVNAAPQSANGSSSAEAVSQFPQVPRTTADILWEELEALRPGVRRASSEDDYYGTAFDRKLSALCLSGGGIRSAAFALGVVQALAAKGLLSSFDYLSSVSGGGYLNSFLQRWIVGDKPPPGMDAGSAAPVTSKKPPPTSEEAVERALADSLSGAEAPQVTRLREGANFITPRLGALSVDSWTAVATAVRNLLVNWTMFLPLFLIVAGIPQIVFWFLYPLPAWGAPLGLALEFLGLVVAMAMVGRSLPSYRAGDDPPARLIQRVVVPSVLIAAAGSMMVLSAEEWGGWSVEERLVPAALVFVAATLAAAAIVIVWASFSNRLRRPQLIRDVPRWLLSSLAGAGVIYVAAGPLGTHVRITELGVDNLEWLVALGPVAFIGSILVAGWVFSAIRSIGIGSSDFKPDLDREWLVRMSAILMKPAVIWLVLISLTLGALLVITGPIQPGQTLGTTLLSPGSMREGRDLSGLFATGGLLSGLVAALAGSSGATLMGYVRKWLSLQTLIGIAVFLFVAVALLAAGFFESWLAASAADRFCGVSCDPARAIWSLLYGHLAVVGALLLWVMTLGYVFNVNRFSLNGFYQNRLGRAFLGAARSGERSPDPLTGFDARDNIRMHSLWPRPGVDNPGEMPRKSLFPVINLTLNVTASARLAWQERKAEPFVVTPFASGSGMLAADPSTGTPRGCYVPSGLYAGLERDRGMDGQGLTLAGAMSISGAAASPNMGYHSSSATAFLMTLFNLRLGAWLPNPLCWRNLGARDPTTRKRHALMPFLRELVGSTADNTHEVYLSDGGHFENLGLYEMIRRRCKYIFVSDGGCDPKFDFTDLGNAIRKISIDLRTDIVFREINLGARPPIEGRVAYAVATIKYPGGKDGTLIYLKPSILKELPMDVNAYAIANQAFPHESTADQWYSESQFESYRRLGQYLTERLTGKTYDQTPGPDRIQAFFDAHSPKK